uniref:AAA+ ATPase domain-containing protein n=1 Tax=viral metagenome TaxID=1070528 RepID=A0A6C0H516_9ZZZZ
MNNFKSILQNTLTNVTPYWSSKLIDVLSIGNEYNMLITLVIGQIVKTIIDNLMDEILILLLLIVLLVLVLRKFDIKVINLNCFIIKENSIKINANIDNANLISDQFIKINNIIIEKNITNKIVFNSYYMNYLVQETKSDILFEKDIYINVTKRDSIVTITIKSKKVNVGEYIEKILKSHKLSKYHERHILMANVKLIKYIDYYIENNCDNVYSKTYSPNNFINYEYRLDEIKENKDIETNMSIAKNENNEIVVIANNIFNFEIKPKLYLTIDNNKYLFKSLDKNLIDDFIKEVISKSNSEDIYKYKEEYCSKEIILSFDKIEFSVQNIIWAINYYLVINNKNVSKIIINDNDENYSNMFKENKNKIYFRINNVVNLSIDNDVILSITRKVNVEQTKKTGNTHIELTYTIKSKNPLYNYLENILSVFMDVIKKIRMDENNEIIYHMIYQGLGRFLTKVLSDKKNNELFETFEHLYNEHNELLINDLKRIKDLEYYKKRGLKRKKGYLFHGIPGSGKTSTVVAMALYDKRHIIEVNFNLLKSQNDMNTIMNLKNINGIEINNENIILLFDEIDHGLKKYNREKKQEEEKNNNNVFVLKYLDDNNNDENELDIAKILSSLDGIGNYNGLIIVGTTNYMDRIDPAVYRELRLTPIEFRELRICDVIGIIKKYFDEPMTEKQKEKIIDRKISPAKCINACQMFEKKGIDELLDYLFS